MKYLMRILTNESTIGVAALTGIAITALVLDSKEIAGVSVGGIAALLRNIKGDSDE